MNQALGVQQVGNGFAFGLSAQTARKFNILMGRYPERMEHNARVGVGIAMASFRKEFVTTRVGAIAKTGTQLAKRFVWSYLKPISKGRNQLQLSGVHFYTASNAALMLETGGTTRPKGGKNVAIPIGHALTQAGRKKKQYWSMQKRVQARGRERFRYISEAAGGGQKFAKGAAIALEKFGRLKSRGGWKPVYLLLPSVTVKPRLGLMRLWDSIGEAKVERGMGKAIEATLTGKRLPEFRSMKAYRGKKSN